MEDSKLSEENPELIKSPLKIRLFKPYISKRSLHHIKKVIESGYVGEGPLVAEFENGFNKIIGTNYSVGLNSCTSALHLALVVAGIKPGDEVITTAQTMMATSQAILQQFAKPVFADVQYETGNIDPNDIEKRITENTKAIMPVHWSGYPCDMDEINKIAKKHNLVVIEDAAHALGATYKDSPIGNISDYTCFSFQGIKHITTADGGMLCTLNKEKYEQAKRQRWFGIDRKNRKYSILGEPLWNVSEVGYKYHMNDYSAALGLEGLKELNQILKRRKDIVKMYNEGLSDVKGLTLLERKNDREGAYWFFTLHVERRLDFIKMMLKKGVEASIIHNRIDTNDIFGPLRNDLPSVEKYSKTHVSIPVHNYLSNEDVSYVINSIQEGW
jgi:perosamine synthetase